MRLTDLLERLEGFYGRQAADWPTDAGEFLMWWQCGYPPADAACAKGWEALKARVGVAPSQIRAARAASIEKALAAGGMIADTRAQRLKEVARRIVEEFGGDLRGALMGPVAAARKTLESFPSIGGPGADRILLFGGIAPVAAVPSNCPQVLVRMLGGAESANYAANYREAQGLLEGQVAEDFESRRRAYLLLKCHGQQICKRSRPKCGECPVRAECVYANGGAEAPRELKLAPRL